LTPLPVLGVPIESQALRGLDSLLSIVQMPAGIPVATFAIGRAGAVNAALFAAAFLGLSDPAAADAVEEWRRTQAANPERPRRSELNSRGDQRAMDGVAAVGGSDRVRETPRNPSGADRRAGVR
jgi:hypothetical protein